MKPNDTIDLPPEDVRILRELGEWKARTAATREDREKIKAWKAHDAGMPGAWVMVLAETWYTEDGVQPVPDETLRCAHPWARWIEKLLCQLAGGVPDVPPHWELAFNIHCEMFSRSSGSTRLEDPFLRHGEKGSTNAPIHPLVEFSQKNEFFDCASGGGGYDKSDSCVRDLAGANA